MKYIQNVHIALIKCKVVDPNAAIVSGRPVAREFSFKPTSRERGSGRYIDTGYTTIEDADYKMLMEQSKTFQQFTKPEVKMLIVHDDLPSEVQTPQDVAAGLRRDLVDAHEKIVALEAQVEAGGGKALADAKAQIAELEAEVISLQDQVKAAKADISAKDGDKPATTATEQAAAVAAKPAKL